MDDLSSQLDELTVRSSGALATLSELFTLVKSQGPEDAGEWLNEIERVKHNTDKSDVVIGIIGATGAGKSSLINALLDEERILPTNCMRACTAVVTEIAYNEGDIPYRADVHFVSHEMWYAEEKALLGDLADDNGRTISGVENTEASIAYAKLRAVYPEMSKDQILNAARDGYILGQDSPWHLGDVVSIESDDAQDFYLKLQKYVDSRQKASRFGTASPAYSGDKSREYWPLIKVVKMYVKSPVLRTGVILVDLPGTQDSNAARAAVAQNYVKDCSTIIVVAPINRAVDDKTAKTILDRRLTQQLRLDGSLHNLVFVCSKTDNISLAEVDDALEIASQTGQLWQELKHLGEVEREGKNHIKKLKAEVQDCKKSLKQIDRDLTSYNSSRQKIAEGVPVFARKRRSDLMLTPRAVKRHLRSSDCGESSPETPCRTSHQVTSNVDGTTDSLTPHNDNTLDINLGRLQELRHEAETHLNDIRDKLDQEEDAADVLRQESEEIHEKLYFLSIRARNEYAETIIKANFATSVEERDQRLAHETDPEGFDPMSTQEDFQELMSSLPVFCVSALSYQKLHGRMEKEQQVRGYPSVKETGIPALQDHCHALSQHARIEECKDRLDDFDRLCAALRLWASGQNDVRDLAEAELAKAQANNMKSKVHEILKDIDKFGHDLFSTVAKSIETNLYKKLDDAVTQAIQKVDDTAARWAKLRWNTYRAVVRRDGCFGIQDFNEDLAAPLKDAIVNNWEKTFVQSVPQEYLNAGQDLQLCLKQIHDAACQTAAQHGLQPTTLDTARSQSIFFSRSILIAIKIAGKRTTECQKEINRQFGEGIRGQMGTTYLLCANESGSGMHERMVKIMDTGLVQSKQMIFASSAQHIRKAVDGFLAIIKHEFMERLKKPTRRIRQQYVNLFKDRCTERMEQQKEFRDHLISIIDAAGFDGASEVSTPVPAKAEIADETIVVASSSPLSSLPRLESSPMINSRSHSALAHRSATPDNRRSD